MTNAFRADADRAPIRTVGTLPLTSFAAGGSLAEIGQVLRHRSISTTAIYAKVDHAALAGLARPWPGGTA